MDLAAEEYLRDRQVPAAEESRMVRDILPAPEEVIQARLRQARLVPVGPDLILLVPEGVIGRQTSLIIIRRRG